MNVIMSQDKTIIVKPTYTEVLGGGVIYGKVLGGSSIFLGRYIDKERAKEILEDIFRSEYFEMPIE